MPAQDTCTCGEPWRAGQHHLDGQCNHWNGVCKECGAGAQVLDGVINRACGHTEAGVTVGLSATCYGVGRVLN